MPVTQTNCRLNEQREKSMIRAFVFGKFLPFHKGHEALIRFALTKCDFLTVLVCCSDKEKVPAPVRENWIRQAVTPFTNVEVTSYNYLESELPNTSVTSEYVSKLWSEQFKILFPYYDLVITSEEYGNYVASFMGIRHIAFDIPKRLFPVSSTAVRLDPFTYWKYLPDSVKPYFAIKVIILGTESTGKTTIAERLAEYYQCSLVKEAGREFVGNSNLIKTEDLQIVALEHAKLIDEAVLGNHPLIIIDTDIHITISYSKFVFGDTLVVDDRIYESNKGHLYLYLTNDIDYVQDGTRLSKDDRDSLDLSHREILNQHGIGIIEIGGSLEERMHRAVLLINKLLEENVERHWP
jgi:HTH-type transcriptional repressor of NAD biosynthesis genes